MPASPPILFFDYRANFGMEMVWGTMGSGVIKRHFHRDFSLGIITRGCRILTIEKHRYRLCPGDIFFLSPETVHSCESKSLSHDYRILFFTSSFLKRLFFSPPLFFPHPVIHDPVAWRVLLRLCSRLKTSPSPQNLLEQLPLWERLLQKTLWRHGRTAPLAATTAPDETPSCIRFLEEAWNDSISMGALAKKIHISPAHAARKFRCSTGLPPHEYLLQIRLRRIRQLLASGNQSLTDIAAEAGFYDQSHFVKIFRQHHGITPGQFRQGLFLCSPEPSSKKKENP